MTAEGTPTITAGLGVQRHGWAVIAKLDTQFVIPRNQIESYDLVISYLELLFSLMNV
jgi:hypothetical protein